MELRHLRYFVALAEELHFARAAERLNIAPPTLTVQIQEMERTLSARLLLRTKRSVKLTPAGEIFLGEARNVLEQFAKAESVGKRAGRGEVGRVEIGYVGSSAYAGVLQDQVSRFSRDRPGVHLNARELPMDELPGLVADGQVDIGFVRLPMKLPNALQLHVLLRDYFCVALPSGHRLATAGPLRASDLAGEPLIAPEQAAGTYEVARRGDFAPQIVSAPGSLLAVLTQVSLGSGISIIPSAVRGIVRLPGVSFCRMSGDAIPSQIAAMFRARENSPAAANLIAQVRATAEKQLDPNAWTNE